MFEKYDGVRGFWNPTKKAFYSRHGSRFYLPQEIIDQMPTDTFLDGEFWCTYQPYRFKNNVSEYLFLSLLR